VLATVNMSGVGETAGGSTIAETREYLWMSEASKGKSQERCEHEIGLAGVQREQTVKRVTKPWRRNEDRSGTLSDQWTFEPDVCCRERKSRRGVDPLRWVD
jgi:hypothetical protein